MYVHSFDPKDPKDPLLHMLICAIIGKQAIVFMKYHAYQAFTCTMDKLVAQSLEQLQHALDDSCFNCGISSCVRLFRCHEAQQSFGGSPLKKKKLKKHFKSAGFTWDDIVHISTVFDLEMDRDSQNDFFLTGHRMGKEENI